MRIETTKTTACIKKILFYSVLAAFISVMTGCMSDDPYGDINNGSNGGNNGGGMFGGNGNSTTTGELATFDIMIDKTSAEPTTSASEYVPDEEDVLSASDFTTEVNIDLSNPIAKTENGVEVTVSGGHVTVNHGSTKKVCYVVSGTTDNGSFTVLGDKTYAVKPTLEGKQFLPSVMSARVSMKRASRWLTFWKQPAGIRNSFKPSIVISWIIS